MADRHDKIKSLIMELVAAYIQREANTDPLITVTNIESSKDYKNATIFVTTIPDAKESEALIFLRRKGGEIRNFVKSKSKFKIIPHFTFEIDSGERHRQHMDEVVKNIESNKRN